MTCIKKIQNTEVFGSKFSSRTLTIAGDISGYTFKAVVKNIIQGEILEIAGVKNAGTINFDFSQLETLKKSTYQIEYWGDFGAKYSISDILLTTLWGIISIGLIQYFT